MYKAVSDIKAILRNNIFIAIFGLILSAVFTVLLQRERLTMGVLMVLLGIVFLIGVFEYATSEGISQLSWRKRIVRIGCLTALLTGIDYVVSRLITSLAKKPEDQTPAFFPEISGQTLGFAGIVLTIVVILLVQRRNTRALRKERDDAKEALVKAQQHVDQAPEIECPDRWPHQLADSQKEDISPYIHFTEWQLSTIDLGGTLPCIRFSFELYNASLFDVAIEDEIKGHINFNGDRLEGAILPYQWIVNEIPTKGTPIFFTIEQRLAPAEVQLISNSLKQPDARFEFHWLKIAVKGGKESPEVRRRELRIARPFIELYRSEARLKQLTVECESKGQYIETLQGHISNRDEQIKSRDDTILSLQDKIRALASEREGLAQQLSDGEKLGGRALEAIQRLQTDNEQLIQKLREKEEIIARGCSAAYLHRIAELEVDRIGELVRVKECVLIEKQLLKGIMRKLVFEINVLNGSVFDVGVEENINGPIVFRGTELRGEKFLTDHHTVENLPYRGEGWLRVEQRLKVTEAELIADAAESGPLVFDLSRFNIWLKGGACCPEVSSRRLRLVKSTDVSGSVTQI